MDSVAELKNIGKYVLIDEVGRGEFGAVYRATDSDSGQLVAIKKLHPELAANAGLVRRFTGAIVAAINLHHVNIAGVYEIGEEDGIPYIVTEFVAGQPLDQFAATHSEFTPVQMLGTFVEICNALHYAHQQQVIHGGLKPSNVIILKDGVVKLTDFGMTAARLGSCPQSFANRADVCFLAPEQMRGESIDRRSDVFSSGVMLYRLLADDLPFARDESGSRIGEDPAAPPAPLSRYLQSYPAEMDKIMARALADRPLDRYFNAAEMASDLCAARDAFKQILIDGYLEFARASLARADLDTAREVLDSLRAIDDKLPAVRELTDELQHRQDPQWIEQTVATLRRQSERAFAEKRLPEAALLVNQALQREGNDAGLLRLRGEIQEAESRRQTLQQLLDDAESALQARKLDEARSAVDQALRLEPHNTRAAFVLSSLVRQAGESGRQPGKTESSRNAIRSGAAASPTIPGSLSIGILSGPAAPSGAGASADVTDVGGLERPEGSPPKRFKQVLRSPKLLVVTAAVILVLGFATVAGVRSGRKSRPAGPVGPAAPAENVPATTSAGSPPELASNASGVNTDTAAGAPPSAPAAETVAASGPGVAASTDLDCDWKIDAKPQARIRQGDQALVSVPAGKHRIVATSLDGLDQWKTDVTVGKNEQKTVQIKLSAVVKKRLDKLQAEQKRLADAEEETRRKAEVDAEKQRSNAAAEEAANKRRADAEAAAEQQRQADAEAERRRAADTEAAQKQALADAEQKRVAALQQHLWADPATGLWWAKRDNGDDLNWRQAQSYCASLTLAGYSHWRLPSIDELQSVFAPGSRGSNRVRGGIQTSGANSYWSSTREGSGQAWTFNFAGSRYPNQLEYRTSTRALCVRKSE